MATHPEPKAGSIPAINGRADRLGLSDLVKFTALASALAIFVDAAIGHAIAWGNDPYWTYWVTDTLLMATVFGLGTAWLGVGLGRGALITAVHVTLLTTYYWTLSPIGLPGQPEWLDLEHTWLTGLPVHLAVYYLGYVSALWLWRRRRARGPAPADSGGTPLAAVAVAALATSAAIVALAGAGQTLALGEFPGLTWFIVRIAVAVPFTLAWWLVAGTDRTASVAGGIALGFLLTTYSHFLAPVGLPNESLRLLAENPPPAAVHWLSFQQQFLIVLPITVLAASLALLAAGRWHRRHGVKPVDHGDRPKGVAVAAAAIVLVLLGLGTARYTGSDSSRVTVRATGLAGMVTGTGDGAVAPAAASLEMTVENRNSHRTPLAPHDRVDLAASVTGADGIVYEIRATEPVVADPNGRFTTWNGVGLGVWHHGRSGIGAAPMPPTFSSVAAVALATVSANGRAIATGVPVWVTTTDREGGQLELHVGDPAAPLPGVANGRLSVAWPGYDSDHDRTGDLARYVFGGGILAVLLLFALAAVRRQSSGTA